MQLALGFVSICLSEKDCSPAGNVTATQAERLDPKARAYRILRVAKRNLENTLRIMHFLHAHDLPLYRISANLIPLATHELTKGWAWWEEEELVGLGAAIGRVAAKHGYRLSSHLPEVCGLTGEATFYWARAYLEYHERLFDLLGLDESAKIVLHLGGAAGGKDEALKTARRHIEALSDWARRRIVLENDDRVFHVGDVVQLAEATGVSVAFDWHHHWVNHPAERVGSQATELIGRALASWRDRPPKVHLSSPKSPNKIRAHADYVDVAFLAPFFEILATLGTPRLDAMIEAKMKDLAAFRLREDLDRGFPQLETGNGGESGHGQDRRTETSDVE